MHLLMGLLLASLAVANVCLSAAQVPRFLDVTRQFGFQNEKADKTGAASVADIDRDGFEDIVMCGHVRDPTLIYFGSRNGFRKTQYFNYSEDRHGTAIGDINGDGLLDVLVTVDADKPSVPRVLLYNRNQQFTEVAASTVGLNGRLGRGVAARFFDVDGDGDLDLLLFNRPPINNPSFPVYHAVYENIRGRYVLRPFTGLEGGKAAGMLVFDYNNDGFPDVLMLGISFALYQGNGKFRFTDVSKSRLSTARRQYTQFFSGAAAFDFDNDGDLDLYLGGGTRGKGEYNPGDDVLLENRNGLFVDISRQARIPRGGVHTGLSVGDLNNDGFVDVFLPREGPGENRIPDLILLNRAQRGRRVFKEFSSLGHNGPNDLTRATGAQLLDYDRDGRLDVLVSSRRPDSDGSLRLYRNISPVQRNYFIVDLPSASSDGLTTLDALVEIGLGNKTYTRRVGSQGEFRTQSFITNVHFGLGNEKFVDRLVISLSTGRRRSFQPLGGFAVNRRLVFIPDFLL